MQKKSRSRCIGTKKSEVQEHVNRAIEGDSAYIFIGEKKVKPNASFVMLFGANFNQVISDPKINLNMADMRVLFCVLGKMAFGNQLSIKQKAIALELGIDCSNVSKSWSKLSNAGIFVKDQYENEFVNFDLFLKGKGRNVMDEFAAAAKISHEKMEQKNIKTIAPFPYEKLKMKEVFDDSKEDEDKVFTGHEEHYHAPS